ncbi:CRISPR-associated protein Cas4 [Acidianus sp. HS-5]|uniref:CRISPR-associated protein Cas4 n=1 Tax=Acidianus sp. HS-5 TaxID=2886040 RepID=UPI001F01A619|nr:CRISPR-associated protein Cas4 [Acidianus sp. HS-5]BDC18755.1 CRISPR-associated protein Cas4 [Acidianus sp. HS-5]
MPITGVTVKHYAYCPHIVRLEALGFSERVTEAMYEGQVVEKEKEVGFLLTKYKEVIRKPIYRWRNLVGSPDFVLHAYNYYTPLDVKAGYSTTLDHKYQVLFYAFIMEKLGMNVKEALLYYVRKKKLVKLQYNDDERKFVEKLIKWIREAMEEEVKVAQRKEKCENCNFFPYCRPKKVGRLYYTL